MNVAAVEFGKEKKKGARKGIVDSIIIQYKEDEMKGLKRRCSIYELTMFMLKNSLLINNEYLIAIILGFTNICFLHILASKLQLVRYNNKEPNQYLSIPIKLDMILQFFKVSIIYGALKSERKRAIDRNSVIILSASCEREDAFYIDTQLSCLLFLFGLPETLLIIFLRYKFWNSVIQGESNFSCCLDLRRNAISIFFFISLFSKVLINMKEIELKIGRRRCAYDML
ncbi:hypothetical protein ACJX0J_026357 [Zea mays]